MASSTSTRPRTDGARFDVRHFFVPARHDRLHVPSEPHICAIIPTYAPGKLTLRLVKDLIRWNPKIIVYVVDDCTSHSNKKSVALFENIAAVSTRVVVLRTPVNTLKAGALNFALKDIFENRSTINVILTLDDDVVINFSTVNNLVTELINHPALGAVCSQCRVFNKNTNILTRLQGLEYLGFNAIRLADEGFFRGPLVMHGMLTAFKAEALQEVGGFAEWHLIEDYEITTRLKARGWSVKSAQNAPAWTLVPERISKLWRQRTRWSYGGITVVAQATSPLSVFQDLVGHTLFLSTMLLVGVLFFSQGGGLVSPSIAQWIIALSLFQLAMWYAFQIWQMRLYQEKDFYDWILRITLFPEFIYSYMMTFALLGSYVFHSFNALKRTIMKEKGSNSWRFFTVGSRFFRACGYTEGSWGTRVRETP